MPKQEASIAQHAEQIDAELNHLTTLIKNALPEGRDYDAEIGKLSTWLAKKVAGIEAAKTSCLAISQGCSENHPTAVKVLQKSIPFTAIVIAAAIPAWMLAAPFNHAKKAYRDWFDGAGESVRTFGRNAATSLSFDIPSNGAKANSEAVETLTAYTWDPFAAAKEVVLKEIRRVGDSITSGIRSVGNTVTNEVSNTGRKFIDDISAVGDKIKEGFNTTAETAKEGINNFGKQIEQEIRNVGDTVTREINVTETRVINGINSVSDTAKSGIKIAGKEVTNGINIAGKEIEKGVYSVGKEITGGINDVLQKGVSFTDDALNFVKENGETAIEYTKIVVAILTFLALAYIFYKVSYGCLAYAVKATSNFIGGPDQLPEEFEFLDEIKNNEALFNLISATALLINPEKNVQEVEASMGEAILQAYKLESDQTTAGKSQQRVVNWNKRLLSATLADAVGAPAMTSELFKTKAAKTLMLFNLIIANLIKGDRSLLDKISDTLSPTNAIQSAVENPSRFTPSTSQTPSHGTNDEVKINIGTLNTTDTVTRQPLPQSDTSTASRFSFFRKSAPAASEVEAKAGAIAMHAIVPTPSP